MKSIICSISIVVLIINAINAIHANAIRPNARRPNAMRTNLDRIRTPTIRGLVVMPPGNFDSNTCLPFVGNNRYDGGGFYLQDTKGNGIYVCPSSTSLVDGISYGDTVEVTGRTETDSTNILLIIANKITKTCSKQREIISVKDDFNEYHASSFGDLVKIEGFVTNIIIPFPTFGSVFFIEDCDGNRIKGWWTESIDPSVTVEQVFDINTSTDPFVPSYFDMIGIVENFYPICDPWTNDTDFQPRFVHEIVETTDPCTTEQILDNIKEPTTKKNNAMQQESVNDHLGHLDVLSKSDSKERSTAINYRYFYVIIGGILFIDTMIGIWCYYRNKSKQKPSSSKLHTYTKTDVDVLEIKGIQEL